MRTIRATSTTFPVCVNRMNRLFRENSFSLSKHAIATVSQSTTSVICAQYQCRKLCVNIDADWSMQNGVAIQRPRHRKAVTAPVVFCVIARICQSWYFSCLKNIPTQYKRHNQFDKQWIDFVFSFVSFQLRSFIVHATQNNQNLSQNEHTHSRIFLWICEIANRIIVGTFQWTVIMCRLWFNQKEKLIFCCFFFEILASNNPTVSTTTTHRSVHEYVWCLLKRCVVMVHASETMSD